MVYQYYVVEIKRLLNGELEHSVTWHWDADQDKARLKAESKWHEVMSDAAVSETLSHGAIMFSSEGFPCLNGCYKHDGQPTPEPEPEAEE